MKPNAVLRKEADMPASVELFRKFKQRIMIETGTFYGTGVLMGLEVGMSVQSIELSQELHEAAKKRLKGLPAILVLGDSGKVLSELLRNIDEPVMFWLDGHCSGGETAKGEQSTPILKELEQIGGHHVKDHTILIDDVRLFGSCEFDHISMGDIVSALWTINPKYALTLETGNDDLPNDIIAARTTL